jgi:hypothetical protein
MKILTIIISGLALSLAACGDDEGGTPDANSPTVDAAPGIDAGWPAFPTLGSQVDRAGRAAITSALVSTFRSDDGSGAPSFDADDSGDNKDAYNEDGSVTGWTAYVPDIVRQLAVLDSLDAHLNGTDDPAPATACGNQIANGLMGSDPYTALAGLLAGDMLFVNSDSGTCTTYLGVEANAVLGIANSDCGGRAPTYDVVETSYSVLSGVGLVGFDDGVTTDDGAAVNDTFPFIGAPLGN